MSILNIKVKKDNGKYYASRSELMEFFGIKGKTNPTISRSRQDGAHLQYKYDKIYLYEKIRQKLDNSYSISPNNIVEEIPKIMKNIDDIEEIIIVKKDK